VIAPWEQFDELRDLLTHVASSLGGAVDSEAMTVTFVEDGCDPPTEGVRLEPLTALLCALPGASMDTARALHEATVAREAAAAKASDEAMQQRRKVDSQAVGLQRLRSV
jgi:hypothetical protein